MAGTRVSDDEFAQLWHSGMSLDDIRDALAPTLGRRISRPAVSLRARALGLPPRRLSHVGYVPRNLPPEHHANRLRHYLEAWSRGEQLQALGIPWERLSRQDRAKITILRGLLYEGSRLARVIVYRRRSPEGFYIVDAEPGDVAVIRPPAPRGV